jgi:hypothetical protein
LGLASVASKSLVTNTSRTIQFVMKGKTPTITDLEPLCCRAAIMSLLRRHESSIKVSLVLDMLGVEDKWLLEKGVKRTLTLMKEHPLHFRKPQWVSFDQPRLREKELFCAIVWKCTKDTAWDNSVSETWNLLYPGADASSLLSCLPQERIRRIAKDIDPDKLTQGSKAAIPFDIALDRTIRKIRNSPKQVVIYPKSDADKENNPKLVSPPGRPLFDASGKDPIEPKTIKIQIEPASADRALPFGNMCYLQVPAVPVGPGSTEVRMVYDAGTGKLTVDCKMGVDGKKSAVQKKTALQARLASPGVPSRNIPMKEIRIRPGMLSPMSDVSFHN